LLLHDDIPQETVNIGTTLAQNENPMVSIQYSSIRPGFQASFLRAGLKRSQQYFCRKATEFRQLRSVQ
jgi:hypothetical protein